MGATT